jgi:hypothetical protein
MLYLNHPFSAKEAMFEEAAALGASTIRVDIELSGVFADPTAPPDWTGVDQYMLLARRYHLHVLADLLATPWYMADCPTRADSAASYRCPPADPAAWARDAGLIAAHVRGVIDNFEIINEPDGTWAFPGAPQQYALILAACYHAIHAADPAARVALGGLMNVTTRAWMDTVLSTAGADAIRAFDIATVHVRAPANQAGAVVKRWRRYLAQRGFHGPLWVTETGYPADPAWQTDPGYKGGPASQARWMTRVIPAMLRAGAAIVFVTERNSLTGRYASEGILESTDPLTADPEYARRLAFYAVQRLIHREVALWRRRGDDLLPRNPRKGGPREHHQHPRREDRDGDRSGERSGSRDRLLRRQARPREADGCSVRRPVPLGGSGPVGRRHDDRAGAAAAR